MTDETKFAIRRRMSGFDIWVGIAYFILVGVVVGLLVDYSHASTAISQTQRIEIQRHAEDVAARRSRRQQCLDSIPTLKEINNFVAGVKLYHATSAANSLRVLNNTPRGTALYAIRKKNYQELQQVAKAVSGVSFTVPTEKQCKALQ